MGNVCARGVQTSNQTVITACTNGAKKPIPLGPYGRYNTKNDAKSEEIQKSFISSKQSLSQPAGQNGLKRSAKSELSSL